MIRHVWGEYICQRNGKNINKEDNKHSHVYILQLNNMQINKWLTHIAYSTDIILQLIKKI